MLQTARNHTEVATLRTEYETFAVHTLTPHIGAEIGGVICRVRCPSRCCGTSAAPGSTGRCWSFGTKPSIAINKRSSHGTSATCTCTRCCTDPKVTTRCSKFKDPAKRMQSRRVGHPMLVRLVAIDEILVDTAHEPRLAALDSQEQPIRRP